MVKDWEIDHRNAIEDHGPLLGTLIATGQMPRIPKDHLDQLITGDPLIAEGEQASLGLYLGTLAVLRQRFQAPYGSPVGFELLDCDQIALLRNLPTGVEFRDIVMLEMEGRVTISFRNGDLRGFQAHRDGTAPCLRLAYSGDQRTVARDCGFVYASEFLRQAGESGHYLATRHHGAALLFPARRGGE